MYIPNLCMGDNVDDDKDNTGDEPLLPIFSLSLSKQILGACYKFKFFI